MASENVVEMGEFQVTRKRRSSFDAGCKHIRFTIDSVGDSVTCDDCSAQLSPVWALNALCNSYLEAQGKLAVEREMVRKVAAKQLSLKAAQRVEQAWRSRSMVPTCPHCHEAIFPGDGFGGSATNREIAVRRRRVALAGNPRQG